MAGTTIFTFRDAALPDDTAITRLYRAGFPDEDLLPLVTALAAPEHDALSLVAVVDGEVSGHVMFTPGQVGETPGEVALLGPLVVLPAAQRQGIGGGLVREGLRRMAGKGAVKALVLGDPAYYGRFGFAPEHLVAAPYPLPYAWRNAWQSLVLRNDAGNLRGEIKLPEPWMRRPLWTP